MLTERTTTLFVSIFYFQKCQTRDSITQNQWLVVRGSWFVKTYHHNRMGCEQISRRAARWDGPYDRGI